MTQFCITKEEFNHLFEEKQRDRVLGFVRTFSNTLTLQEMVTQMEAGKGEFAEEIAADTKKFGKKTENTEIITAFHLADFYFPNENPQICLTVKDGFPGDEIISYDTIVANIENDTSVDCSISASGREFNFQIKRYPQAYLNLTREDLTSFISKIVRNRYGDMKGAILIIVLQPNTENPHSISFKDMHDDIMAMREAVSFDEVNLVFNDRGQQMRWQQIYPQFGHSLKPVYMMSEKYQEKQAEWLKKSI